MTHYEAIPEPLATMLRKYWYVEVQGEAGIVKTLILEGSINVTTTKQFHDQLAERIRNPITDPVAYNHLIGDNKALTPEDVQDDLQKFWNYVFADE